MIEKRIADSAVAAILIAIGLAELWGGFTMDRLEIRQIHPATIPGLLPMFLGGAMALLGAIVFVASRKGTSGTEGEDSVIGRREIKAVAWVVVLAGIYALVLVGRVHFWLASSLFVAAFVLISEWPRLRVANTRRRLLTVATALIVAVGTTGAIAYMFEYGFLVRLP